MESYGKDFVNKLFHPQFNDVKLAILGGSLSLAKALDGFTSHYQLI